MGERSAGSDHHRKIRDVSFLVGPHAHIALERLAAEALTTKEFATALKYADRRIRVSPPPAAHCFVLRAEAAWRLDIAKLRCPILRGRFLSILTMSAPTAGCWHGLPTNGDWPQPLNSYAAKAVRLSFELPSRSCGVPGAAIGRPALYSTIT